MKEIKNNKYWIRQQDNLEFMKELIDNSIDLIYNDCLYNTGKKFKDYDDRLGTPQEAMEWYKPRLIEMKRILKDTGSIYLQCDYRLVHYLKVLMDEVFGIKNFRNDIVWCYRSGGKSKKNFSNKHDNILWYSKDKDYKFNISDLYIENKNKSSYKKVLNGKTYNYDKSLPIDWWDDCTPLLSSLSKEYIGYNTQKPKALLNRIIKASSNEGDVVADFFMGSCTTGEVALELKRKFIGCDIGDKAFEISKDRLEKFS